MTLPGLLRLVGVLLAVTAAGSVVAGLLSAVGTLRAGSGPDASLGILMLFLGGAVQSFWQALAGSALALLCFAAARLLETTDDPGGLRSGCGRCHTAIPLPQTSSTRCDVTLGFQPVTDSLSAIHHLLDDVAEKPAGQVQDVYRSSNGDLWQLVREASGNRMLVRHTPNASSGGAASEMSVEEFLAVNGSGPEHEALRLLLGKIPEA